jgi:dihydroflavonol-4-reductase
MKIALTGATGLVGGHVAQRLLREGFSVRCLIRSPRHRGVFEAFGCQIVMGSLEDEAARMALVDGVDDVYHVAGLIAARSEAEFERVNVTATRALAEAAARSGVRRFVHVSSLAVTGPSPDGSPLDECGEPRPVTPYGLSKRAGEDAVRSAGVPFTILRPPAVYGPRDRAFLRLFRFARFGFVPLLGDGTQRLTLVHVGDLAEAIFAAGASERTTGGTYHAGGDEIVTQRELALLIGAALGKDVRTVPLSPGIVSSALRVGGWLSFLTRRPSILSPLKGPELLAPAWTASSAALERDAGWVPEISLGEGLAATAEWYRARRWL